METTPVCTYCARPILGLVVWGDDAEPYHSECTIPVLTESDVRRIVRDEFSRLVGTRRWIMRPQPKKQQKKAHLFTDNRDMIYISTTLINVVSERRSV